MSTKSRTHPFTARCAQRALALLALGGTSVGQIDSWTASDAGAGALFGQSSAQGGGLALIGAPFADGIVADTGKAYLIDASMGSPTFGQELTTLIATDGEALRTAALEVGVNLTPGRFFGAADHVRIGCALPPDDLRTALARLDGVLAPL